MAVATATLAGLGVAAIVIVGVYLLGLWVADVPPSSRAARAFRFGYPLAGSLLIGGLAAVVYDAGNLVRPASSGSAPIDIGILHDFGLGGTVLGLLIAVGLLLWLAVASSQDLDSERADSS
ncbi:hypothetical protein [Halococcoides cellulosivorans]|uniref:Uncharacterized protein n=1 Tax=Halococcoides cellulosivorans TaxID=1679096 RepID=A0A2R4WZ87_9EURY|nr:hypothetical protein [Halococcoides cellulosivorans]AWB26863.1 hypothetical protein HARCEL1_03600 [Halococcoides cellulosivorans]